MRTWEEALQEHKQAVLNAGFKEENILGIFAYGSQNYKVETENSDWDTKAIIIPTYEELVMRPPVSKEIHLDNGEHVEIKDIREIVKNFKKQNINFIEILYTEYNWVNRIYKSLWTKYFINNRHEIANYDINKTIQSICGQALHTLSQNPNDPKKVANGFRLERFIDRYLNVANYRDCIVLPEEDREKILYVKKTGDIIFSVDDIKSTLEYYKTLSFVANKERQAETERIMGKGVFELIAFGLRNDEYFTP